MKPFGIAGFVLLICVFGLHAQSIQGTSQVSVPSSTPYAIVSQDGNSRVWQRVEYEAGQNGVIVTNIQSYKELATGLNYLSNGQWIASQERISILPNGTAAATNSQSKVYFPVDISAGQIEMVTPDGKQIVSQPEELSYFDGTNTVILGEITNSVGVLVGNNQVIYPNAFCGIKGSLRYTITRGGFEQDVILLQQPLTPEYYGLNPETARIQMVTEFFGCPTPSVSNVSLPSQAGISLTDQCLGFGVISMGTGRAFLLGNSATDPGILVAKSWLQLDGRQFLVEEVPVNAIVGGLAALPLTAMNEGYGKASHLAMGRLVLPRHKSPGKPAASMITKGRPLTKGFVLDYQTVSSSVTNFVYQGDTTYYISGPFNSYGKNTFEGGAVLKYATNGAINITPGPPGVPSPQITWKGLPYLPVVFTAKDDNSVGNSISGSTGTPTNYYATMLYLAGFSSPPTINGLLMSHAATGINSGGQSFNLYNAQLSNCYYGINCAGSTVGLYNALFSNTKTNLVFGGGVTVNAENVTFDGATNIAQGASFNEGNTFNLLNCILSNDAHLTNGVVAVSANYNGFYNCPVFGSNSVSTNANPFMTVGAGAYYLTPNCLFHNYGTTNIDATLFSELPQKTTWPPLVISNVTFSSATNFSPYASRDTNNSPDLGYHFDSIDYLFSGVTASAPVAFNLGAVGGAFPSSSSSITMSSSAVCAFTGNATAPDYWIGNLSGSTTATFTRFVGLNLTSGATNSFTNCEFWVGSLTPSSPNQNCINCLFDRTYQSYYEPYTFLIRSCTFHGGTLSEYAPYSTSHTAVIDTSFDSTSLSYSGVSLYGLDYNNAYISGQSPYYSSEYPVYYVTNFNWQSSWFGNYYLPTNSPVIQKGNTYANLLGLYHFTTQTNQVPEANAVVDIGYHYVATDQYGNPLDTNGDGIPDYLEDANGDGLFNVGDLANWLAIPNANGNMGFYNGLNIYVSEPKLQSTIP